MKMITMSRMARVLLRRMLNPRILSALQVSIRSAEHVRNAPRVNSLGVIRNDALHVQEVNMQPFQEQPLVESAQLELAVDQ